jgi:hypothetical protein
MRPAIRVVCLVGMSLVAAFGYGQEAGYVNVAKASAVEPKFVTGTAGGAGIGTNAGGVIDYAYPIEISLVRLEPTSGLNGPTVEWTARIRNTGTKSLVLPDSNSWSGVASTEGGKSKMRSASFSFLPTCGGKRVYQKMTLGMLYGDPGGVAGITVDPGQWVTIVGSGRRCPVEDTSAQYSLSFSLDLRTWTPVEGGYSNDNQTLRQASTQAFSWNGNQVWVMNSKPTSRE